jgi:glyoxylase-like metal-dependent hydrolase (beta-lactamase superfamily II)
MKAIVRSDGVTRQRGTLLLSRIEINAKLMNIESLETYTSNQFTVAPGVWGKKDVFVNFYMIQDEATGNWALVDAGLKWSAAKIKSMAKDLFGEEKKPVAIILTHGHFDHVGALGSLIKEWNVPVYAHYLEHPYLNGKSSYPPADPSVGGGLMSTMSWIYPSGPSDFKENLKSIPENGSIPGLSEWRVIHTPGHSPGHISLFRERDKVLIAGDAFVTTQAESAVSALMFTKKLSGPPKYFTCNWASAKQSIIKLAALNPEIVATGHGKSMDGEELRSSLSKLISNFDSEALPAQGRYVNEPAVTNEEGIMYLPPAPANEKLTAVVKVLGVALAIGSVAWLIFQQSQKVKKPKAPKLADLLKFQYN